MVFRFDAWLLTSCAVFSGQISERPWEGREGFGCRFPSRVSIAASDTLVLALPPACVDRRRLKSRSRRGSRPDVDDDSARLPSKAPSQVERLRADLEVVMPRTWLS